MVLTLSSLTPFFCAFSTKWCQIQQLFCSCKPLTSQITHLPVSPWHLVFGLFAVFSLVRPLSAYLPLSSPLTSPLPFTSWTKSPLPFHCICLLAIIISAVNHHRCAAVFSPALLSNSPQTLLIVLYLHNLSTLCLSFPVYSQLLLLFSYILHG